MVPDSRCQACAHAQLQCDGGTPCAPCKGSRIACLRHPDPVPSREQSASSSSASASASASSSSSSSQLVPQSAQQSVRRTGRIVASYQPLAFPIDETVSPSLAVAAFANQQTEVFTNYILACFPCYFKCTEKQVPVNWIEFVNHRRGAPKPFDWALRACTAAYTGALYRDERFTRAARDLYLRSLRGLAVLLSDPATAASDESLATAISLAIYEKHHCTEPDAWLRHAAGIRTLMKLRGPDAHVHGFGRALYLAYRHFLITHALITGEACFLENPEWQAVNEQIVADNAKLPDSSLYTDVVERGSLVVIKIPGHVKEVRDLRHKPPKEQATLRPALLQRVQATRAALRGIHTEFGVAVSMLRSGHARDNSARAFIGPLPHLFFDGYSILFDKGVRSGLRVLNYCIYILDPTQRSAVEEEIRLLDDRASSSPAPSLSPASTSSISELDDGDDAQTLLTPPDSPGEPRLQIRSMITPETKRPPVTPWMDRIITTMGMEGVEVRLGEL